MEGHPHAKDRKRTALPKAEEEARTNEGKPRVEVSQNWQGQGREDTLLARADEGCCWKGKYRGGAMLGKEREEVGQC